MKEHDIANVIRDLKFLIYDRLEHSNGGLCQMVSEVYNYEDEFINYCIGECNRELARKEEHRRYHDADIYIFLAYLTNMKRLSLKMREETVFNK